MKLLNMFLLTVMMSVTVAQATPIISDFRLNGDVYIDTSLANETRAVGVVNTLYVNNTQTWASGDLIDGAPLYVYMVAEGITPLISPSAPLYIFSGIGGTMNIFGSNYGNLLDTSASWNESANTISEFSGLLLGTDFHDTINGISSGVSYAANGFLEVINGDMSEDVVSGGVNDYDGVTDLSFNASGTANILAPIVHADYQYITSANITGKTTLSAVPVPGAIWMLLSGLGVLSVSRKRSK